MLDAVGVVLKRCASLSAGWLKPFSAAGALNSSVNFALHVAELDAVLRPLRAGQRLGTTVPRSSSTTLV